jgi:hypothetical protein
MTSIKFQTDDCSRCGGSGRMPFAAYGGVCFKCNGHGKTMTRAGQAARKTFIETRDAASPRKKVSELEPGDKFMAYDHKFRTVVSIKDTGYTMSSTVGSGATAVTTTHAQFTVETQKMSIGMSGDQEVMLFSAEAQSTAIQKVLKRKGVIVTTT